MKSFYLTPAYVFNYNLETKYLQKLQYPSIGLVQGLFFNLRGEKETLRISQP